MNYKLVIDLQRCNV